MVPYRCRIEYEMNYQDWSWVGPHHLEIQAWVHYWEYFLEVDSWLMLMLQLRQHLLQNVQVCAEEML